MKIFNWRSSTVIVGLLFFVLASSCTKTHRVDANAPVLQVLDYELSAGQFSNKLVHKLKDYDSLAVKDPEIVKKAQESIINEFMTQAIVRNWAKKNKIFVRKEQLDEEIARVKLSYPDKLSFRRALSESQQSYDQWRDQITHSLLEKMVYEAIKENIEAPNDKEIRSFYRKNRRQFYLPAKVKLQQVVTDSEPNAEKVLKELKRGKSMGELAKKYSISAEAANDGVTDWIERGALPVFNAAFSMSRGQRSGIKKSPFGYHIYILLDKKSATQQSLKQAKTQVSAAIVEKRQEKFFSSWLESELKKVTVLKNEGFFTQLRVETTAQ